MNQSEAKKKTESNKDLKIRRKKIVSEEDE